MFPKIETLTEILPAPGNNYEMLVSKQDVFDIVREAKKQHGLNAADADKISVLFWQGTPLKTAQCLFDFCKKYIPYDIETKDVQTVKSVPQILQDAQIGNIPHDCKHYALFCCSIIDSLNRKGYPVSCFYRFASDLKNERYPKHVFCVMQTNTGQIWIDPVLNELHQFHKYYYVLDKYPKDMALYRVSGLGDRGEAEYISGFGADIGKHGKGKAKFKKFLKKISPGQFLVKAAAAPARNAFLLIVKVNGLQMGKKFFEAAQNENGKNKIKNLWQKVGGKWGSMAKAINAGYHHYLFQHKQKMSPNYHNISGNDSYTVGFALAAAIATAAPVIAAFSKLLKELGINTKHVNDMQTDGANLLAQGHNENGGFHADGTETEAGIDESGKQILHVKKHGKMNHESEFDNGTEVMTHEQIVKNIPGSGGGGLIPSGASPEVETDVENKILEKQANQEIAQPTNGAEVAVNVATDWAGGFKNFVVKNKGLVIAGGSIIAGTIIIKTLATSFGTHKKRR